MEQFLGTNNCYVRGNEIHFSFVDFIAQVHSEDNVWCIDFLRGDGSGVQYDTVRVDTLEQALYLVRQAQEMKFYRKIAEILEVTDSSSPE
jgi:hypothetical protein